jgi:cellulose synthase/poly-beta-1,6-N-acetylglucosamine synthase-like glycosyltransferase
MKMREKKNTNFFYTIRIVIKNDFSFFFLTERAFFKNKKINSLQLNYLLFFLSLSLSLDSLSFFLNQFQFYFNNHNPLTLVLENRAKRNKFAIIILKYK